MHRATWLSLTFVLGCAGDPATEDPDPGSAPPPVESADTGTEESPDTTRLTFDISGDFAGTSFALVNFSTVTASTGPLWFTESPEQATLTVALGDPPAGDVERINSPGVSWAWYIPGLFDDANGDLVPDPGEVYVGVAQVTVMFIQADDGLPDQMIDDGFVEGWNILDLTNLDDDGPIPFLPPEQRIPLPIIPLATTTTIGGTYDLTDAPRFALLPTPEVETPGTVSTVLHDDTLASEWTITVTGEPPSAHRPAGELDYPEGASTQFIVEYDDVDGSGGWSVGDTVLDRTACDANGTRAIRLLWVPQTDDIEQAQRFDGETGWLVTSWDAEGDADFVEDPTQGLTIGTCGPP